MASWRYLTGLLIAGITFLVSSQNFAAERVTQLSPVSPWQVEWAPQSCRASRGFGDKDHPSLLVIERFGPTQNFNVVIIGRDLLSLEWENQATVYFGDNIKRVIDQPVLGIAKDRRTTLFFRASLVDQPAEGVGQVPVELERAVDHISIKTPTKTIIFSTGPLDKMFKEVNRCAEDLFRVWNLDKEEQFRLSRHVTPTLSPGTWFTTSDYPIKQLMKGNSAMLTFTVLVSAEGEALDCIIPRAYGDEAFQALTCDLLKQRAHFIPALDFRGDAVKSVYFGTVRWVAPGS